ncbi:MAG: hypothetical protein JWM91_393 [Rhodospirillales bacterium]|nr:hypothetical protein [Rhodospirillales bacterium]
MRDLIATGLALFLGVIGIFYAYGLFGSSNSNSQIQETFLELQQARTELSAYANQNGGYGTAAFTNAQIAALQLLPTQATAGGVATDQWRGGITITGNTSNFFADYTNIDSSSCTKLITKTPANSGITGIAVAATVAALAAATVNALPISAANGTTACAAATNAVRFVIQG